MAARLRAGGRGRSGALMTTVLAVAGLATAAPSAGAAVRTEQLCHSHVELHDHPRGVVIGHLYAPQRVEVTFTDRATHWWRIRTRAKAIGWIPPQTGC